MIRVGDQVGNIELRSILGAGGMGQVFEGWDDKLKRRVAVKVIRSDRMDSQSRVRFLREAQVLSQLKDPRICAIYDYVGGESNDFLILEYIEGITLTKAIKQGLAPAQRLQLAIALAEVLIEAHQNGVIHRDLKPENVMVTTEGELRVLDFGLSCSVDYDSQNVKPQTIDLDSGDITTTKTLISPIKMETDEISRQVLTGDGRVLGTLSYMSPEQLAAERLSPATDMFSTGLILQEMWTGDSAYDVSAAPPVLMAAVAQGAPRPHSIKGELGKLVNELTAFSPESRPNAAEVRERLQIIQHRPRQRIKMAVGALIALSFILMAAKYTFDLRHERNAALVAQDTAEKERDRADEAQKVTQAGMRFLENLFLGAAPEVAQGNQVDAIDLLNRATRQLETGEAENPAVKARLELTIGNVYMSMGRFEDSKPLLESAVNYYRNHHHGNHYLKVLFDSGALYSRMGDYAAAERAFQQAYELTSDPDFTDLNHRSGAASMLAIVLMETGKYQEATEILEHTLELRREILPAGHIDLAHTMVNLGVAYRALDNHERTVDLWHEALEIYEVNLGYDHPATAGALANLSIVHSELGQVVEALDTGIRALDTRLRVLGKNHVDVAASRQNLAKLLLDCERLDEAEKHLKVSRHIYFAANTSNHSKIANNYRLEAQLCLLKGNPDRGINALHQAIQLHGQGRDSATLASDLILQGRLQTRLNQLPEAEVTIMSGLATAHEKVEKSPVAIDAWTGLAELELRKSNPTKAIDHLNVGIQLATERGRKHLLSLYAKRANIYRDLQKTDDARRDLRLAISSGTPFAPYGEQTLKACQSLLTQLESQTDLQLLDASKNE